MTIKRTVKLDVQKDIDSFVLKNVKDVIEKYKAKQVKVGIIKGETYSDGTPVAEVGMVHEFGSERPRTFKYKGKEIKISGIPTRSFLRMPARRLFKKGGMTSDIIKLKLYEEFQKGYTGKTFETIGQMCVNEIKEAFATQGFGEWEPNISEQYKELKGSSSPLIDTGQLWGSISYEVSKKD